MACDTDMLLHVLQTCNINMCNWQAAQR